MPADPSGGFAAASWRNTAAATGSLTAITLPMYLVGTVAVDLSADLHFDEARLGLLVSVLFMTAALTSVSLGRLGERIGPEWGMRLGTAAAAAGMIGIAVFATGSWTFAIPMALCGIGPAFAQPSVGLWLSRTVPPARQGMAFAVAQAGPSVAGVLAGLSVPAITNVLGWRWALAFGGAVGIAVVLAVPSAPVGTSRAHSGPRPAAATVRRSDVKVLVVLAGGMALATGVQTAFAAFLVTALVEVDVGLGTAGLVFAVGNVLGIGIRLGLGRLVDRREVDAFLIVAAMFATGGLGFALLAVGSSAVPALLGALIVFLTVWGWHGLFALALVTLRSDAPSAALGITNVGAFLGAGSGPPVFGALVGEDFTASWACLAVAMWVGAVLIAIGRRMARGSDRDMPLGPLVPVKR